MQDQTTRSQGWLSGLKVPFNFNALALCFAAVVIFQLGVWGVEATLSEGYLFERVVQRVDDSLDARGNPYLKFALGMISPRAERATAAVRLYAEKEAQAAREHDDDKLLELEQALRAESLSEEDRTALEAEKGTLLTSMQNRPSPLEALRLKHEADGTIHSLERIALRKLGSYEIKPIVWILIGLLAIVLWSFLAAAVCRISAMHLARDQGLEIKEALEFAKKKGHKILLCLAIPAGLIIVLWGLNSLFGLVMNVAVLDILLSLLFVLVFLSSFFIVFVLFLSLFGSNLMASAVATESSDVFDGISRAWDYLTSCPWHAILYYFTVAAYILIFSLGVQIFVGLSLSTLSNGLFGLSDHPDEEVQYQDAAGLTVTVDKPSHAKVFKGIVLGRTGDALRRVGWVDGEWVFYNRKGQNAAPVIGGTTVASAYIIWFWVLVAKLLALAYVLHYWLSANTTIYFLLRREVDEDDFDQIYLDDEDELASLEADASFAKVLDEGLAGDDKPAIGDTQKVAAMPKEKVDAARAAVSEDAKADEADEEEEDDEGAEDEGAEDEEDVDEEEEEEEEEDVDDEEEEEEEEPAAAKEEPKPEPKKDDKSGGGKGKKKKGKKKK